MNSKISLRRLTARDKHACLFAFVLLASILPKALAQSGNENDRLAQVALVKLNQGSDLRFPSLSDQGFLIVAATDCTLFVGDRNATLKAGEYKKVGGTGALHLRYSEARSISLVLVRIASASQPLTIQTTTLAPNQHVEDASDRNDTLLIAIDSLRLRDSRNLEDEGDPWKAGSQATVQLRKGQTLWLKAGMHRVKNIAGHKVRFVTVEW